MKCAHIALAAALLTSSSITVTAEGKSHQPFKVVDRRGKGQAYANLLATKAATLHRLILLIHGDDHNTLANAELVMNQVYESGRHHIDLILGDGEARYWDIFANGKRVTQMEPEIASDPHAITRVAKAIERIYDAGK